MTSTLALFLPELGLLGLALGLFILAVTLGAEDGKEAPSEDRRRQVAAQAEGVALWGAVIVVALSVLAVGYEGTLFYGAYDVGGFSQWTKVFLALGLLASVWLARGTEHIPASDRPEFSLFLVLGTVGMMMLVSANELVAFYVALELSAYSLYIVVPLARGHGDQHEAAFKYFLYGAALSAASLWGMSILYGLTGTTSLPLMAQALAADPQPLAVAALVLTLTGVLFKLSVFPFHFWAPDVYETSAHPAAAFIAGASKVGAVAALLRLLLLGVGVEQLATVLAVIAVVSMTVGNLSAVVQKDLKRLLAWSGVAQGAYVLLGLLGRDEAGYSAAMYYVVAYLGMIVLCFIVVVEVGRTRDTGTMERPDYRLPISSLRGLHSRSPWLAAAMLVGVLGLAGVPPTAGFTGKWLLFKAAMDNGAFWLVLVAGVNNTIAVYYYLLVLKATYVDNDDEGTLPSISVALPVKVVAIGLSVALVVLGVAPQILMEPLQAAMAGLF